MEGGGDLFFLQKEFFFRQKHTGIFFFGSRIFFFCKRIFLFGTSLCRKKRSFPPGPLPPNPARPPQHAPPGQPPPGNWIAGRWQRRNLQIFILFVSEPCPQETGLRAGGRGETFKFSFFSLRIHVQCFCDGVLELCPRFLETLVR